MADDLEQLDRLLAGLSDDPLVSELEDRVADSGHVSDEPLEEFKKGGLSEAAGRAVRRHLLFCDQCSSLVIHRGGEVEAKVTTRTVRRERRGRLAPEKERPRTPRFRLPLRLLGVVALMALAAWGAWWTLSRVGESPAPPPPADLQPELLSLATGATVAGGVSPDEELALLIRNTAAAPRYAYVLLAAPSGAWRALHPDSVVPLTPGEAWFPPSADPAGAGDRKGWTPRSWGDVNVGDELRLFVLASSRRVAVLEGDMLRETTLPAFTERYSSAGRLGRADYDRIAESLRSEGLAEAVVEIPVVIR